MLSFKNITKVFQCKGREVRALNEISFEVKEGEFVSFVGKSGAGKTTLAKILIAEYRPTSGRVVFQGEDIHSLHPADLQKLRRKIGVVYQDYKLLCDKTVQENLEYILQILGASDESIETDVLKVLGIVGLEEKLDMFPLELSGGEQQRLAIARALIHRPELIIADEPTGNLDTKTSQIVMDTFKKLHSLGKTIVLITHEHDIAQNAKRIISLRDGQIEKDEKL